MNSVFVPAHCSPHGPIVRTARHGYVYSGPVPWRGAGVACCVDFVVEVYTSYFLRLFVFCVSASVSVE